MAKRGRKPKEKKGYFYETEEQAVIAFINETNPAERERLFNSILHPAFIKMIESIIRRYKLYVPDEEFEQTFNDTISYLMTKINNYKPIIVGYDDLAENEIDKHSFVQMSEPVYHQKLKNALPEDPEFIVVLIESNDKEDVSLKYCQKVAHEYKAYSYCGTVCRNYLMSKVQQFSKDIQRNTPYDTIADSFENNINYTADDPFSENIAQKLVGNIANEVREMTNDPEKYELNENELKVGIALVDLLDNWEDIFYGDAQNEDNGKEKYRIKNDSNKLLKSTVLYFLREETMMTTKEVRDNMKKYKSAYKAIKQIVLS